jgi:hypothetical protein
VIEALLDYGTLPGPVGFVSAAGLFEEAKSEDPSTDKAAGVGP